MYIEGSEEANYHRKQYGHPSKFGYKDIVPLWKAEKWDPEGLLALYKSIGARYFVAQAVHLDNFDNWNSRHHRWNSVETGPRRDIIGEWRSAARKAGIPFGVSEHLAQSYDWFGPSKGHDRTGSVAGVPYDGNDPKYQDLYHLSPSANQCEIWSELYSKRIHDLVDRYAPDLLFTGGPIPFGDMGQQIVRDFLGHQRDSLPRAYVAKDTAEGSCTYSVERGLLNGIQASPWQAETCVGNWFYNRDIKYKSARQVIQMLVEVVSRNGNLLLNLPLRPDGTLDADVQKLTAEIAAWTKRNGEGIYETTPWLTPGEGPTRLTPGALNEAETIYTANDVRFTAKDDEIYAFVMEWPSNGRVELSSLNNERYQHNVGRIELLGSNEPLRFQQRSTGVTVELPREHSGDFALGLKIAR